MGDKLIIEGECIKETGHPVSFYVLTVTCHKLRHAVCMVHMQSHRYTNNVEMEFIWHLDGINGFS